MSGRRKKGASKAAAAPDISILGDQVMIHPGVEEALDSKRRDETHDQNLVEHMARFRESPLDFLREISLHVSGTGWRSYDNFIGQPIYYPGFTDTMKSAVMAAPMLREKIASLAHERVQLEEKQGLFPQHDAARDLKKARRRAEIEESLRSVALKMTDDMVCKMESRPFIRGAYYMVTQLLTRAYHQGIHVSSEEVLRLRSVAEKAAKNRQSIIFLPCHRSHVDYVSLQLICYRLGLALPTVVAGDNLNFPVVGPFLQSAGAMWIRRSFSDDKFYQTLLQSYIDVLLQRGFNFECFIEGGRSRIGKLLPPKFGILSYLLDSVMSGRVKDAIICPVSTQYDKVIEVNSYISELLGTPKRKENLSDFLSASSILSLKLGRVDVRFHEPWSLRGFIEEQQVRFDNMTGSQQANLQKAYNQNLRIRLLRTLGYKVLSDINDASVVMPTSLIGTVLLTLRGLGVGKSELIRRVEWLSDRVRANGGRVAHFAGLPTRTVVERGLEVLGPDLVGSEKGLVEETFHAVDRFQLSFYRNMTIHLFISQALVCASMYTSIKAGSTPQAQSTSYSALRERTSFLSQLFRGEFIFATTGLTTNLNATIASLEKDGVIKVNRTVESSGSSSGEAEIESVELSETERSHGRENFDFYCFLLWPFIEASWLGAVSMMMLTPPIRAAHSLPEAAAPTADEERKAAAKEALKLHASPYSTPSAPASTSTASSDASSSVAVAAPSATPAGEPEDSTAAASSSGWIQDPVFLTTAQTLGKTLYAQGDLTYFEAVNKETLKNAYTCFGEEGILLSHRPAAGGGALVRLADDWRPSRKPGPWSPPAGPSPSGNLGAAGPAATAATPANTWSPGNTATPGLAKSKAKATAAAGPSTAAAGVTPGVWAGGAIEMRGRLWDLCEEISRFRLEGKNRRDGEVNARRMMRLIDACSAHLWRQARGVLPAKEDAEVTERWERSGADRRRRAPFRAPGELRASL